MWKKLFNKTQKSIKENKAIVINETAINYIHIQKTKKNISLKIDQQGLIISTPFHTPQSYIEAIIKKKIIMDSRASKENKYGQSAHYLDTCFGEKF